MALIEGNLTASTSTLYWLPAASDWRARLAAFRNTPSWDVAVGLANSRLDFLATNALDAAVGQAFAAGPPDGQASRPVRLAILGSSTVAHLHAGIRVAGLRRGLFVTTYETDYGQYWQELHDKQSGLYRFQPTTVLFALDAYHLSAGADSSLRAADAEAAFTEMCAKIENCWSLAREAFHCPILHQTPLPVLPALLGNNEHRLPGSRCHLIHRLNGALRGMSDKAGVELVAVDERAGQDGIRFWHDPVMWHNAKQEISPTVTPMYGELIARLLAAAQGRSAKCLMLDLDNTIWGGAVGDDGLEGIVLGEGSALGEAFISVQKYAKELHRRGVILAVCSKNSEPNALEPFEKHPEMVLRRDDIASFVANWSDKAANIRTIADELNIGVDSLVFVDDNAFERNLVRQELPMVAVPELPDEPALIPQCLADAGYFESFSITEEDRERTNQYRSNRVREELKAKATDLPSYLRSLEMQLLWRRFDRVGLQRTVQLINKTNQFNLTTRRYSEGDVLGIMADNRSFGLQLRLLDRLGDNGIIGIVIGRMQDEEDLLIDTWLMSCRVLGRQVELATLNLLAHEARTLGAERLVGEYIPTKKNGMVRDHYSKHGFKMVAAGPDGTSRWVLELASFVPADTFIDAKEG
jgi:FkbH-like protein